MVRCGKVTVLPPQESYKTFAVIPHEVADWAKRWLGDEAEGTAVNSWLKTPNSRASAALTGICSGAKVWIAVLPRRAPRGPENRSL
jgi:hypothetical protein